MKTLYSDSNGQYTAVIEPGTYRVRTSASGYLSFESYETVGESQVIFLQTYLLVQGKENDKPGKVGGTITNSVTGQPISGVKLSFYKGWNTTSGSKIASKTTDRNGGYSINTLPLGNYTVVMECTGYTTAHFNIAVTKNDNLNWHGVLNPNGQSSYELGDMRIILTWGATPSDLDSHLRGPGVNGGSFHTYWNDMNYSYGGVRRAFLDVDDISSYGPETTTVYNMTNNGTYRFYVHDYTNKGLVNGSYLANSGARVRVYMGDTQIAEYHVPTSGRGNVWHVFDFDAKNRKLIPVNSFSNCANSSSVGQ